MSLKNYYFKYGITTDGFLMEKILIFLQVKSHSHINLFDNMRKMLKVEN